MGVHPCLLVLLLSAGVVCVAAVAASDKACDSPAGCINLQRLAADKWELSDSGHPARQNIFCRASLSGLTRSTPNASRALEALCSLQQPRFYSGSALDAWMAARFLNHSTTLNATATERPLSTEPNTPWMLADVVLTNTQEQRRADSWRKVRGDAQVCWLAQSTKEVCRGAGCVV